MKIREILEKYAKEYYAVEYQEDITAFPKRVTEMHVTEKDFDKLEKELIEYIDKNYKKK